MTQIERGRTIAEGDGQVTQLIYNSEDRLTSQQQKQDDGSWVTVANYTYDSTGNPLTATTYRDGQGFVTNFSYDALNRLKTVTDPANNISSYRYDALGNRVTLVDAKSNETHYLYDNLSRLTRIEQQGVTPYATTTLSYDAASNLLTVTDPEQNITTYAYDALSRRTSTAQPLGQQQQMTYDSRGRIDYMLNARNHKIDYNYAAWGGLSGIDYYDTEAATTPTRSITHSYDNNGNLASSSDDSILGSPLYNFTYDSLNRVDTSAALYLPAAVSQDWDYDRFGNLKQHTFNDGTAHSSAYNFNKLNHLTSATLPGNPGYSFSYFTGSQQLKQITHPSGITTGYAYYNHGPLQTITTNATAGQLEQFSYSYEPNLNIDTLTSSREAGVHDYDYDGLDRLTQASHPAATGLATEQFTYDQVGNREDPADSALYDYDGNNRITASPSLTYGHDNDGNQISRSDGLSYTYSKDNRLIVFTDANDSSNNATYQYDPFGRRISKTVNGQKTWFVWSGSKLIAEYDSTGTRQQRYSYLPNGLAPIQTTDANGSYAIHSNHLQTPKFLTDQSQNIVWSQFDKAFGEATVNEDVDGDLTQVVFNVRFAGQYIDSESGLHYNYFRDYDPTIGRYIQSDPIGILRDYSNPQLQVAIAQGVIEETGAAGEALNHLYGYVGQNPLFWIDPFGLANSGQTNSLGRGVKIRIDNGHVPGQQRHAHVETPRGKVAVNQDGTKSHKSRGNLDVLTKKIRKYLRGKGFKLGFPLIVNPCLINPFMPGCTNDPNQCPDA